MYNSGLYNTFLYNGHGQMFAPEALDAIMFNDYSLQSSSVITRDLIESMPARDFQREDIPLYDGEFILGDFWRGKRLDIKGLIRKSSHLLLEQEMDTMRKALAVREGSLDINFAGETRRFVATLINGDALFAQRQHFHVTTMPFEASFICVDPYGKSITYNSDPFLAQTALSLSDVAVHPGTAKAKPVIILSFVAASGITQIRFKNNTRNEEIVLTKSIVAGDYIQFDTELFAVTVNGIEQDYSGSFPFLDPGSNLWTLTIIGTSAIYDLTIKYKSTFY